jgi:RHS repeat-associated protein
MSGRTFNSNSYKYGFNGKENDNETVGTGSGTQDYGMRIYNPALGRFLSVDPLTDKYPWYTPYQFAGNMPIRYVDVDGLEEGESKISMQGNLSHVFGSKKMNFGVGVQYQASDKISMTLNTNNATDNNKITFSAFANINKGTLGMTLNSNGSVKLLAGKTKQSEIPTALLNSQDGTYQLSMPPVTKPIATLNDVSNNNTNTEYTLDGGVIKKNPSEENKAEETTTYGTNYSQNPPTKEETQNVNTAISTNTKPVNGAKTKPSKAEIKTAILNSK